MDKNKYVIIEKINWINVAITLIVGLGFGALVGGRLVNIGYVGGSLIGGVLSLSGLFFLKNYSFIIGKREIKNKVKEITPIISSYLENIVSFNPDDQTINTLFSQERIIAITNANPIHWNDKSFSFYLLNNFINQLSWRYPFITKSSKIEFNPSRSQTDIEREDIKILSEIAKGYFDNVTTARFYFLSEDDIVNNQDIISYLIAGHELFGCNLFLIKSDKLSLPDINSHHELISLLRRKHYQFKGGPYTRTTIDFAFSFNKEKCVNLLYKNRTSFSGEPLTTETDKNTLIELIKSIAGEIIKDKSILYEKNGLHNIRLNMTNCRININEIK